MPNDTHQLKDHQGQSTAHNPGSGDGSFLSEGMLSLPKLGHFSSLTRGLLLLRRGLLLQIFASNHHLQKLRCKHQL